MSGRKFSEAWTQKEDIKHTGINIFIQLYGGKQSDTLRSLRLVINIDYFKVLSLLRFVMITKKL